ncbi:hypothetical protein MRB53_002665 [Persea americana]|uniref:Uncharacterized protein n=1 Tax=Persea americana TaxID=3435 RepID=A0ACC2MV53_PERAE|nr:hypothetical protein MRB53_002665 [Persea americana]
MHAKRKTHKKNKFQHMDRERAGIAVKTETRICSSLFDEEWTLQRHSLKDGASGVATSLVAAAIAQLQQQRGSGGAASYCICYFLPI